MIQKIQSNEYLKRIGNMTAAEKEIYLKRVGEWLEKKSAPLMEMSKEDTAQFQNAIQCSVGWNDAVCQAWTEGAHLLTALVATNDTWLPDMLYVKAAKRSIRNMISCFKVLSAPDTKVAGTVTNTGAKEEPAEGKAAIKREQNGAGSGSAEREQARPEVNQKATQAVAPFRAGSGKDKDGEAGLTPAAEATGTETKTSAITPTPVRPKHIDQYVHLLPEATQKKAAMVQGLLRDFDTAREKARLLMDDPNANDDSRAQWAKSATAIDNKLKAIYKELDAEWEKLVQQGRVTVDDLGNAHVVPAAEATGTETNIPKEQGAGSKGQEKPSGKRAEKKAERLEYLKKWLRDTRTSPSPERKKQWEKNCKELLKLGGDITDSIRKAADVYGVNLDDITK